MYSLQQNLIWICLCSREKPIGITMLIKDDEVKLADGPILCDVGGTVGVVCS